MKRWAHRRGSPGKGLECKPGAVTNKKELIFPLAAEDQAPGAAAGTDAHSKWKKLVLATRNRGKMEELKMVLTHLPLQIVSLLDYPDLPHVEETGQTFAENALLKAETICRLTGEMTLADDSGLEVDCLDGRPGVYSARFSGAGATDEANNARLLASLKDVPPARRGARFVCIMALALPGEKARIVEGTCEGKIATNPRGSRGFGYDPLFQPGEAEYTFAQMEAAAKNRISHRGQALEKVRVLLEELLFPERRTSTAPGKERHDEFKEKR